MTELRRAAELLTVLGIPTELADDLLRYFLQIADDLRFKNLEKASVGKFVETVIQILQSLDPSRPGYDSSVRNVDRELSSTYESRSLPTVPDERRIPIVRISRAMYSFRSKRGMIHKNAIDPSGYDLEFAYNSAKWIVSELVGLADGISVEDASLLISQIQRPVLPLIENILGRPLVLSDNVTTAEEAVLVLYSAYHARETLTRTELGKALDRRSPSSVTKALASLYRKRLIEGRGESGYRLSSLGVKEALNVMTRLAEPV